MASKLIDLEVTHNQLAVFSSSLENPFNHWTDRHVAQGFAWRPGSVSFRTLRAAGLHRIEVRLAKSVGRREIRGARAIVVPFEVHEGETIEVASIPDSSVLSLPAGQYELVCDFDMPREGRPSTVRLLFAASTKPRFEVLRADEEISITEDLLRTAVPAV
jgi:hypothetical protein